MSIERTAKVALVATAILHLGFAVAIWRLAALLGVPLSPWATGLVAVALTVAFRGRLALTTWDRQIGDAQRLLVEEPYFVHWCALGLATLAFVPLAGATLALGRPVVDAAAGAYVLGFAVAVYGVVVRRRWARRLEVEVPVVGLPHAFDGYRIVQLSDLHVGSLCPPSWVARWVRHAHALEPDLVVLTGDYVTMGPAYHRAAAAALAPLRAPDGVVAIMGNHDYHDEGRGLVEGLAGAGITLLRNEGLTLRRGASEITLIGLDDRFTGRFDLLAATAELTPEQTVVALAHDPVDFEALAEAGAHLVLSGHTHWGQLAIPGPWAERLNAAAPRNPRCIGLHRHRGATLWIHPGLGTTALPLRLGTAPTVAAVTLRRTDAPPTPAISGAREPR